MSQQGHKRVLLVAAENDALKGAKVGGMADVIRDLPPALSEVGVIADVAMPNYGFLAQQYHAKYLTEVAIHFAGKAEKVIIYVMRRPEAKHQFSGHDQITSSDPLIYLFEHPYFNHQGQVYCNGSPDRPFAQDATKFALFSLSVATALKNNLLNHYDVMHLHDWHAAMVAMLRSCVTEFSALQNMYALYFYHP
ncbi:glycogen/starch synthase [Shewanella aestuarii]|uniref:starch synthase n=1 Tax=Shewanella aestuarii TaxID=1028752 RepID=A0A6G9QKQ5_9GAMM|nr:glycogen/starch synthase [Shewanella aestuarii]QIR14645.1 glycogen/starch synthase [Shewanella aestuarii]